MADNARGIHVSPGIYSKETELTYAVKSLGITTLGLVGETQRGPAFQPMLVENWREFQSLFGGTSPEKFLGSQYPKYELPYIAKSYLTESNQLQVCRVLGLSGYNAGPAWVITTTGIKGDFNYKSESISGDKMVVAVLRSRGFYEEYHKFDSTTGSCECPQQVYDALNYRVGEKGGSRNCKNAKTYNLDALALTDFIPLTDSGDECKSWTYSGGESTGFDINSYNLGRFKIVGIEGTSTYNVKNNLAGAKQEKGYFEYPVSLNPNDKEYILKVLGTDPVNGDSPIYVEALYDVALKQMVESENVTGLSKDFEAYQVYHKADYCFLNPVNDIISKQEESLSRRDVGKRFLADKHAVDSHVHCHMYNYQTKKIVMFDTEKDTQKPYYKEGIPFMQDVELGQCYTVKQYTDVSGKRHYYYAFYDPASLLNEDEKKKFDEECAGGVQSDMNQLKLERQDKIIDQDAVAAASTSSETKAQTSDETSLNRFATLVRNNGDGKYYRIATLDDLKNVYPVTCDMNDYRDAYRFASTPWIVSNIKGDFNKIELNKLFRFHTISDGSTSNNEVKISIQNVRPDERVFDVVVRDINDTDDSQVVLERFGRCTMTPNTRDYIAYKIGSFDGVYESKSKYITVEVNETDAAINSVPAGYLGYPLSKFDGLQVRGNAKEKIVEPLMKYNLNYDEDVKHRKQYFGLSSWSGVDIDAFTYKGNAAYSQEPEFLSQGFHLDSRLNMDSYGEDVDKPLVTVDGIKGYHFDAVSANNRTHVLDGTPIIDSEINMMGSIYEYVDLRKFTVYFYGGFDGWDVYRDQRSNTDNFRRAKYLGDFNELSGEGLAFNAIDNPDLLKLNQPAITSDWYAYLSAIRQFSNPEEVDINVFATPGIDLINNKMLAQEVIEMIEEERADSIYVATMPDKPMGASDFIDEMYTPDDVVYELDDTEIDSNYTCTYYPWIKYEDVDNSQYIYLPPTKDVVRNMAMTDNTTHPWFAPAGISRGDVNCVRAHYVTKLSDEDVLYEGRINPIKTFASDGVKVWGQKNLQKRESQLNRIAVRRLLLRMRKLVAISCIGLIFEPNDATTKDKFLSTVTPILDNIRANRGISDYKIEVNDTIESRERRELPAKIFFKPYNALEYIDLNFILTPEGVSFDNI